MSSEVAGERAAACEICSKLKDIETSFIYVSDDERSRPLPIESSRLERFKLLAGSTEIKRCPICGTFYRYSYSYEYLVGGSEEEEELRRLPGYPTKCDTG